MGNLNTLQMKKYYMIFYFFSTMTLGYGQENHIPWKISSPEEQGMNSLTFINGMKSLEQENTNIHSLLVIRNDYIVLDAYFYPFQKNYVHDIASVTKSITSLLIGIAIDKGLIKNEDELVCEYFPDYPINNDTLKTLRIKDLLNMASGFQCSWNDGERELNQMRESDDWVKFMFSLPFETKPGEKFSYCSGNYYLLAEILQRTSKMTCHDFAKKFLFQPLNFDESHWLKDNRGVNNGWGDLYISTYDMAKIGSLILDNGKWDGKQVISKEWIEKIKPQYKIQKTESYGYGWWLDSENPDEIQAIGRGGQRLFIFKDRKMIISTTGGGFDAGDIDNLALESIKSYHKNNYHGSQLERIVDSIQYPFTNNPDSITDTFPLNVLNKTFQFERNDLNLQSISFDQRNKDYYITIYFTDSSKEEHSIGMDNQYKISNERVLGLPIALKGFWDNDKLVIYYNELCRINLYKFIFKFYDNSVDFDIQDQTNNWNALLKGSIKK
jgi:CubicO group peptidase (beta-lactamase class C family)